jgi:hypothetical protein
VSENEGCEISAGTERHYFVECPILVFDQFKDIEDIGVIETRGDAET